MDKSLKTDLKDIGKTYMSSAGCHMWVAEWNCKAWVWSGLLHNESHDPGVADLYRIYVLSGIAGKLLERLVSYAREQQYHQIILNTTSAQKAAFGFYKKSGLSAHRSCAFLAKSTYRSCSELLCNWARIVTHVQSIRALSALYTYLRLLHQVLRIANENSNFRRVFPRDFCRQP